MSEISKKHLANLEEPAFRNLVNYRMKALEISESCLPITIATEERRTQILKGAQEIMDFLLAP